MLLKNFHSTPKPDIQKNMKWCCGIQTMTLLTLEDNQRQMTKLSLRIFTNNRKLAFQDPQPTAQPSSLALRDQWCHFNTQSSTQTANSSVTPYILKDYHLHSSWKLEVKGDSEYGEGKDWKRGAKIIKHVQEVVAKVWGCLYVTIMEKTHYTVT